MHQTSASIIGFALATLGVTAHAAVPPEGWVVWASTREGNREIYLRKAQDVGTTGSCRAPTDIRRLTDGGGQWPEWSPDGAWIAYTRNGRSRLVRPDGSEDKEVCGGRFLFWKHDGQLVCEFNKHFFFVDPDADDSPDPEVDQPDLAVKDFPMMEKFSEPKLFRVMGITHDNRYLLFMGGYYRADYPLALANGSFSTGWAALAQDLREGHHNDVYLINFGCEPHAPPSGDLIYHVCGDGGGCPNYPDIYRLKVGEISQRPAARASYRPEVARPDADWGHEYFPRLSNKDQWGKHWMVYGATNCSEPSSQCHSHTEAKYEVFVRALGSSQRTRITCDSANDNWPDLWVGPLWPERDTRDAGVPDDAGAGYPGDAGVDGASDSAGLDDVGGDRSSDGSADARRTTTNIGAGDDVGAPGMTLRGGCRVGPQTGPWGADLPGADLPWLALLAALIGLRRRPRRRQLPSRAE